MALCGPKKNISDRPGVSLAQNSLGSTVAFIDVSSFFFPQYSGVVREMPTAYVGFGLVHRHVTLCFFCCCCVLLFLAFSERNPCSGSGVELLKSGTPGDLGATRYL